MVTGAVISAAGHRSSASKFQPLLPIGNTTVIRRIIITLQQAGIGPIVVVTGDQGEQVEKHVAKMRVICLRNEAYAQTQMYDSICMGLNYIEDLCDQVLVMPTKAPMFLAESIERLLKSQGPVACPVYGGKRGHPVLLSKAWIRRALEYQGELGLRGFLGQTQVQAVTKEVAVDDHGIILAVETDQDCKSAVESVRHRRIPLHGKVSLYLEYDQVFFGPGIAQFLELVEHTGSMQTACRQMHMSYSKGWKIIKNAEKQLGYPLLVTRSGGAEGGFSQLTPKTKELLRRFLQMEEQLRQEADRLVEAYFGDEGKNER